MIRKMACEDKEIVLNMMRVFYASDAVWSNGSDEIFITDIEKCISDYPYVEGYVYEDKTVQGYMMLAKSYSTEFGKPCIWIEDIYVKEEYRGKGIASQFLNYVEENYKDALIRLEVEDYNEKAVALYKKHGFDSLPYMEMKK